MSIGIVILRREPKTGVVRLTLAPIRESKGSLEDYSAVWGMVMKQVLPVHLRGLRGTRKKAVDDGLRSLGKAASARG